MSYIPEHIVDEILQRTQIEEIIGEFVTLKKAGSNLRGLSPFTDEKTPSFFVSPSKQIFKCFSTGKGGTAVTFLMEKEHYSYPEALRWLAKKYNIEIPQQDERTEQEKQATSEKEALYVVNEFANKHFQSNLHESTEGKNIGYSYFVERDFSPEIIEKFQLGYCLNTGTDIVHIATEKGYQLDYFEKVGLVRKQNNHHVDFFRGRVIFPIHSVAGRVLGFGARTLLADKNIAKYFNSPESSVYNKSEILYGLYFAKNDIIKKDNCFLCEGYTDVISLYQAGVQNVVSSSGTSLTSKQIQLIKRYTQTITILYDGDKAGINASFRGIDLILQEGLHVRVVQFPQGEDPDSFARKTSQEQLINYLDEQQQDFISFKAAILLDQGGNDPIKKAHAIRDILTSVALIPDAIARKLFAQQIAANFDFNTSEIENEIAKIRLTNGDTAPTITPPKKTPIPEDPIKIYGKPEEFELIRLMILYGTHDTTITVENQEQQKIDMQISVIQYICDELAIDELSFETPLLAKIHQIYLHGLANDELHKASVLKRQEDQRIAQLVAHIEANEQLKNISPGWKEKNRIFKNEVDNLQKTVLHAIYSFKLYKIRLFISQKQAEIHQLSLDKDKEEQINEQYAELMNLLLFEKQFNREMQRKPKEKE